MPNTPQDKLVKNLQFLGVFGARPNKNVKNMQTAWEWCTFCKKRVFATSLEDSHFKNNNNQNIRVFARFFMVEPESSGDSRQHQLKIIVVTVVRELIFMFFRLNLKILRRFGLGKHCVFDQF